MSRVAQTLQPWYVAAGVLHAFAIGLNSFMHGAAPHWLGGLAWHITAIVGTACLCWAIGGGFLAASVVESKNKRITLVQALAVGLVIGGCAAFLFVEEQLGFSGFYWLFGSWAGFILIGFIAARLG